MSFLQLFKQIETGTKSGVYKKQILNLSCEDHFSLSNTHNVVRFSRCSVDNRPAQPAAAGIRVFLCQNRMCNPQLLTKISLMTSNPCYASLKIKAVVSSIIYATTTNGLFIFGFFV